MSFFDKKQDVIDIKLTQFGKNLLARGFFKPVYYRFFDDDILYNSECASISENQNRSEQRILESQRLKTQHLSVGVETSFDHNQNLINSGTVKTFMEISRRQDPLLADKMLKYPLENTKVNSQEAPRFMLSTHGAQIRDLQNKITVEGIDLPVPQLILTASYTIVENRMNQVQEDEIPKILMDSENYLDLSNQKIEFLDQSYIEVNREDLIIDLEEIGVEYGLDNFEIEIFEIVEESKKQKLVRLENQKEIDKYFNIETDSMITGISRIATTGRKDPRGRN